MFRPILRFAPSPNGELHLGHALSALVGCEMAARLGGRFLVRIEDIDVARCRQEFVTGILEDLRWLGIEFEEPVLRQSLHLADYGEAVKRLAEEDLVYPCFATRSEIATAAAALGSMGGPMLDPDGAVLYPGLHKHLTQDEIEDRKARGEPFALRLHMDRAIERVREVLGGSSLTFREMDENASLEVRECHPELWGDVVVVRKDAPASYFLAATYDDARQGITHVTRGRDLLAATSVQRLLQVLLGLSEPIYHHHRLILDESGRKLSKSARDTSLRHLREGGATPSDVRRLIGIS